MLSRAVCVESMVLPSGRTTAMLGVAGRWWKLGAWMVMKWPVAPVSATQLLEVYMLNGLCVELARGGGGEDTETFGVMLAGVILVTGLVGLGCCAVLVTENARWGSVVPLT